MGLGGTFIDVITLEAVSGVSIITGAFVISNNIGTRSVSATFVRAVHAFVAIYAKTIFHVEVFFAHAVERTNRVKTG